MPTTATPIKITAEQANDEYIDLTINGETINCKVLQSGKIKFNFKHPDIGQKMEYEGLIENNYLWLYPILGEGVLADSPINIK